jgi:hypothetical protein
MSKRSKRQNLLAVLDDVFGPLPDMPQELSPKAAAKFIDATDDNTESPSKTLPRCDDTGKVCYPSRRIAAEAARRVQKKRTVDLRVYFCESCKHHHLTSKNP